MFLPPALVIVASTAAATAMMIVPAKATAESIPFSPSAVLDDFLGRRVVGFRGLAGDGDRDHDYDEERGSREGGINSLRVSPPPVGATQTVPSTSAKSTSKTLAPHLALGYAWMQHPQGSCKTPAQFTRILCGVEGNPSSTEAARQAIALSTAETSLRFIAVYTSFELGPDYTKERLQEALDEAVGLAEEAGIPAAAEMQEGRYASKVLLAEAEKQDLLVIGTHGRSRVAGILLGSTASEAAHGTHHPLLIAREPPSSNGDPRKILFASDGSEGSWPPARVAGGLGAAGHSIIDVIHVDDGKHPGADAVLSEQAAEIAAAVGEEPELLTPAGHPTEQIVETARKRGSSLIVCGRRGLTGIKSLGSVSERVVHQAGCSVMLIPAH